MKILISLFLTLSFMTIACFGTPGSSPAKIVTDSDEALAYGLCRFKKSDYPVKNSLFCLDARKGIGKSKTPLRILYPVYSTEYDETGSEFIQCLFRVHKVTFEKIKPLVVTFSLKTGNHSYYSNYFTSINDYQIIQDTSTKEKIKEQWKNTFKRELLQAINKNSEHEMELLLYLRFFGQLPEKKKAAFWKKDPLIRFLLSISGYNDIRDAIPTEKKLSLKKEVNLKSPPDPILLPQVQNQKIALEKSTSSLARYVPRSCYYMHWDSITEFESSLRKSADFFDRWSKGSYPMSFSDMTRHHLKRLGLDVNTRNALSGKLDSIVLSGWDFNFQSGTNLLAILKFKDSVPDDIHCDYFKIINEKVLMLSTGKKLFNMALKAFKKGKSLYQISNFRYSRNKLENKKPEDEKFFLYLSDFWLTNFISPRWKISTDRLTTADAKIRLAYLLREIYYAESSMEIATLEMLKKSEMVPKKYCDWLFKDLEEINDEIHHRKYGSLKKHKPVDTLDFKQVTSEEYSRYQKFKTTYQRRWRQMDPIALSVFLNKTTKKWGSRLYISPISNNSKFRFIRSLGCKPKLSHSFDRFQGQAFGISIAVATRLFGFWMRKITLPMNLFVQFTGLDFASSSYLPVHWLEKPRRQALMSFMRLPGAIVIPELLISGVTPMFRWINRTTSIYTGIDQVNTPPDTSGLFPLYVLSHKKNGTAYIGLNPNTLSTIRKTMTAPVQAENMPCDIRAFTDFKYGYMMKRKLLQLAVKNRAIESWKRSNRAYRVSRMLGFENDSKRKKEFESRLAMKNIFPIKPIVSKNIVSSMPVLIDQTKNYSWRRPVIDEFKRLPKLFTDLNRLDFFASVESNAILIETHYRYSQTQQINVPESSAPAVPQNQPAQTQLDFDSE